MLPLTQPPASFQEPLSNEAGALRNRLSRPKALEGRDGSVGQLGKMPINNLHVRNAGVQSKEAILCGPGGVGVNQFLEPVLATVASARVWKSGKNSIQRSKEASIRTNRSEEKAYKQKERKLTQCFFINVLDHGINAGQDRLELLAPLLLLLLQLPLIL
jgi:hypothetical protein